MKKYFIIISTVLFLLASALELTSQIVIIKKRPGSDSDIRPKSLVYVPISAEIENNVLAAAFDYPLGTAVITVSGPNGEAYNNIVDTDIQSFWSVETISWEAGDYTLTIECSDNIFDGDFVLE